MISIDRDTLFALVRNARSVVPKTSPLQPLTNIVIECTPDNIQLTATSLDIFVTCRKPLTGGDGNETFKIAVNAHNLYEILREIPQGNVSLAVADNTLSIASSIGFSCAFAGANDDDFPMVPSCTPTESFYVSSNNIRQLIQHTNFSVKIRNISSIDVLSGILLEITNNGVTAVGTNGHVLASYSLRSDTSATAPINAIVPVEGLKHIAAVAENDEQLTVELSADKKWFIVRGADFTSHIRLIDGQYPDYRRVIPKKHENLALVDRVVLSDAIRRVSFCANKKSSLVKLHFADTAIEISAHDVDTGNSAKELIEAQCSGEKCTVGYNSHYLREILDSTETQKTKIQYKPAPAPTLILPEGVSEQSKELYVIMPMLTQ